MSDKAIDVEFADLSFNARLLLKEMSRRGISLKGLDAFIVKAVKGNHTELIYDIYTSLTSYPIGVMIDDKYYTKQLLKKHGYHVAVGEAFTHQEKGQALKYANRIGYPVVIKSTVGSHGEHVYMDIESEDELADKIALFVKERIGNGYYLVEKQVKGDEYRLFITKDGFFAAVHRVPANVVGDGVNDLASLVEKENYRRMNPRDTCLCEIKLDQASKDFLSKNKLTLDYVPKKNEKVFLRKNSNVSSGGNCYEVTKEAHPSVVKLAKNICTSIQAPFVGIDLLCEDIGSELNDYTVCELNGAPGLSMHMMPESGEPQDTASAVADLLFPETKL